LGMVASNDNKWDALEYFFAVFACLVVAIAYYIYHHYKGKDKTTTKENKDNRSSQREDYLPMENLVQEYPASMNIKQSDQAKELNTQVDEDLSQSKFIPTQFSEEIIETVSNLEKVGSWKGNGKKNTEPFTITKTPWVIVWINNTLSNNEPKELSRMELFSISVCEVGNEFSEMIVVDNASEFGDITYIYEKGTFYLSIYYANSNWIVEVYK